MKFFDKKIIAITILLLMILFLPFHQAHASGVLNIGSWVIGKVVYVVNYIMGFIAGIAFTIAGWLIGFALNLNAGILDQSRNAFLYTGWNIILGFADLALILAIIIIAFATILKLESYGMKKALWKLIVAALLVNFSLVIAGVFIDFAGVITQFFITKSTLGPLDMATTLASVFDIQKMFSPTSFSSLQGAFSSFNNASLIAISSVFFTFLFTVIAEIVLFAIFIMLLIRYVMLSILLMISPIVLVLWIFPATQKHWKEWWNNFIRWTMFAPAVTFFLYLSIAALQKNPAQIESGGVAVTGLTFGVSVIGQMVMAIGLLFASLIAANKMGIITADVFYKAGQGVGKQFGGWVGRTGIRAGTSPLRGKMGQKLSEGMQKYGAGRGRFGRLITGAPLVNRLGQAAGTLGAQQGEKLIKQAEARQKPLSDKQLGLRVATMSNDERTAALTRLAKNKNLDLVPNVAKYIADPKTKKIFENYGQNVSHGNVEKAFGANSAMLNAKNEGDRKKAAEEFYKKFSKNDWNKVQFNDAFSGVDPKTGKSKLGLDSEALEGIQEAIAHGIVMNNPGDTRKILLNVNAGNFTNAHSAITRVSSDIRARGDEHSIDIADQIREALGKTLNKRMEGELFEWPETTTPPPAA